MFRLIMRLLSGQLKVLQACQCNDAPVEGLNDRLPAARGYPKASSDQTEQSRQWYWFGVTIVALTFCAETALTWRKGSTLFGDVGNDLYMPWRLCQGAVLYRDLFFFAGGPFSQYFNALLFKIFGASVSTFAFSNLAAIALMLFILFKRFAMAADAWTAMTICLGFIVVFAFPSYFYPGCNYFMPYSDEAVHGLVLSVLGIVFLTDWLRQRRLYFAILAGFCNGIVFLTKPDIFLALMAADITAFILFCAAVRNMRLAIKSLAVFIFAGSVPPLFFLFYFLRVEGWRDSFRSVVFGWVPMFNPAIIKNPFYQWCTGLDRPYFHLRHVLLQFVIVSAVTTFYAVAFRVMNDRNQDWKKVQQRMMPVCAPFLLLLIYTDHWLFSGESLSGSFLVMLAFLWPLIAFSIFISGRLISNWVPGFYRRPWAVGIMLIMPLLTAGYTVDWIDCGYSLPLAVLVSCAVIFWNRQALASRQKFVFPFLWSIFALVLLSKLGVFPRIWHYGFVLAMPASLAAIYLLFWLLPTVLEQKWRVPALPFRGVVWVLLILGFASLFRLSLNSYANQNVSVSAGDNRLLASGRLEHAKQFDAALDWIDCNVPKNATLAVLPEGATINFLTGRINPTPCVFWDQNVMSIFGQKEMTSAFEESPPDYVLIVERKYLLVEPGYLGSRGYGYDLMQWIQQNYQTQTLIGKEPMKNGEFGIKILKRLSDPLAVSH